MEELCSTENCKCKGLEVATSPMCPGKCGEVRMKDYEPSVRDCVCVCSTVTWRTLSSTANTGFPLELVRTWGFVYVVDKIRHVY